MNRAPGIDEAVHRELAVIVSRLETAWNTGDGDAFAAPFAEDADFVNIRAEHFRGRDMIARGEIAAFHNTLTTPGPSSGASPGN